MRESSISKKVQTQASYYYCYFRREPVFLSRRDIAASIRGRAGQGQRVMQKNLLNGRAENGRAASLLSSQLRA